MPSRSLNTGQGKNDLNRFTFVKKKKNGYKMDN
jgi:hypothetical protein